MLFKLLHKVGNTLIFTSLVGYRCHNCIWNGHRQTRRAVRHPLLAQQINTELLSRERPRRTRRQTRAVHSILQVYGRVSTKRNGVYGADGPGKLAWNAALLPRFESL